MAQTRSQTSRKKPAASSGQPEKRTTSSSASKKPIRREIGALACAILAVVTVLSYFFTDGFLLIPAAKFFKGLLGYGYFLISPMLIACSVTLFFHRGRPVVLRVICTLLIAVFIGSLAQLFGKGPEIELSKKIIPELYMTGVSLSSGGLFGGIVAVLFKSLVGKVGAIIIILICTMISFAVPFGNAVSLVIYNLRYRHRVKQRERLEYEPEPVAERAPLPESVPVPPRAPRERRPLFSLPHINKKTIDIPLDDGESTSTKAQEPKPEKDPLFDATPGVKTPDMLFEGNPPAPVVPDPPAEKAEEEEEIYDLPLDIPFMEARVRPVPKPPAAPEAAAVTVTVEPSKSAGKKSRAAIDIQVDDTPKPVFEAPVPVSQENSGMAYLFPSVSLLSVGNNNLDSGAAGEVTQNSERLESAFGSFGVSVKITNTTRGPSVTRYEAELEVGVKLSKVTGLADDIALSLGSGGVRIAAMPDRISTIGIEVPNKVVSTVFLRDLIEAPEFAKSTSKLSFAIGKSIAGESIIGNIAKLPHLLVAGTTGSGKSVCLNSLILSILYKATPDDVRLIMIDPKMVEFRVYNGIPHLLVPVVTEAKKASGALQWAVLEMMRRYKFFSESNARDLEGYNNAMRRVEGGEPFPQIVVIIDELADLMMTCAKEVEDSIVRIAQMGRAAGVHLVIATQSPRADVITGLMKANIPSRIALKVSSSLESRIILDAGGNADKLIGNGDMLYAPIGAQKPLRVQGAWVTDEERESVVDFIKKRGETQYSEEVMSEIEKAAVSKEKDNSGGNDNVSDSDSPFGADYDELLPQAVDVIFESAQASTSMLQRRLKLGYSRAARIIDQLEELGILGPFEGSKPRQIMMTKERWRELQYSKSGIPADSFLIDPDDFNTGSYDDSPPF